MPDNKIILFDGICQLCHFSVKFIKKRDSKNKFIFYSLQSKEGSEILKKYLPENKTLESVILIDNDIAFIKSAAALQICYYLDGSVKILFFFKFIPEFFRDFIYDLIAKYRYKIFGVRDSCSLE